MKVKRTRELLDEDVVDLTDKETSHSYEVDNKMRMFVNMIIDRVLEDQKKGMLLSSKDFSKLKNEGYEIS